MNQSRVMSLVESIANAIVGYCVAVVTQILIFPIFGLHSTLAQNLKMGAIFTVVSIARSSALRRAFEVIRVRSYTPRHAANRDCIEARLKSGINDAVQRARASGITGSANGASGSQT